MRRNKDKLPYKPGNFITIPRHILDSQQYIALPIYAKQLLLDIYMQFTGYNNGDLSATWNQLKKRGWRSRCSLYNNLKILLAAGFIEKTRQGGKNKPTLYGVTWNGIDECKGKLDVRPTPIPSNLWKNLDSVKEQINTTVVPLK